MAHLPVKGKTVARQAAGARWQGGGTLQWADQTQPVNTTRCASARREGQLVPFWVAGGLTTIVFLDRIP
jgi:hypothetical protein